MDPAHNFGQIRLHLSRALFHLNHLASLIPFFVIEEDTPEIPPVGYGRHLVRWTEMGPATTPASTSSRPLVTHGQLPSSMVLNPEPHLRPLSVRRHLDADSSTPRGRQSTHREVHPPSTPATGSGDPLPMAAPRPAKRPRTTPSTPAVPTPGDSSPLASPAVPDAASMREVLSDPIPLPVCSDDSATDEDPAPPAHPGLSAEEEHHTPPTTAPTDPPPRMGHTIRGWAPIDDTELTRMKQDTKGRYSWKAIGQRLHRDPDSCKARWYWLKSSRPELSGHAAAAEVDD